MKIHTKIVLKQTRNTDHTVANIMIENKTLYVYKASAGSGKTFTLALEYIKLLITNPKAYKHTLAVTFTNKATGEMKEHILSTLYGVANRLPSSEDYFEKLCDAFPEMSDETIQSRATEAMNMLLHDYGHFRIQTIDAFFQSVLRGLAKELELSGDIDIIIENSNELLSKTVDLLIKRLTPTSQEMGWLVEFVEENLQSDKGWNVRYAIKNFSENITQEEYQQKGDNLRRQISENNGAILAEYRKQLNVYVESVKKRVKENAGKFFDFSNSLGLTIDDYTYKNSGTWGYFEKQKDGTPCEAGTRMVDYMNNPSKISKKLSDNDAQYIAQLIRESHNIYNQEYKKFASVELSLTRFHQLRLLNKIAETLNEENTRENRFLLAQTAYLLSRMIDKDTSFIFEKIGTEINHIFIDEFQDTSRLQWMCFKVLLAEVMSRGGFNLIVGDVKQAIYRWRNSDWNILNNMEKEFSNSQVGDYLSERMLCKNTTNYRSYHKIVKFNNALFRAATKTMAVTYGDELGTRINDLTKAYSDVEQELSPYKSDVGYTEMRLIESAQGEEFSDVVNPELTKCIKELIDNGVKPSDITILVRKRKVIPEIIAAFNRDLPQYSIVSDTAYQLSSSTALRIIIAAIRNILTPEDYINTIELVKLYNRAIKSQEIEDNYLFGLQKRYDQLLPPDFVKKRKELAEYPIIELVEQLMILFGLNTLREEEAYIYSFLDITSEYLASNSNSLNEFIKAWDEELGNKSIPSENNNSVSIVTMHKSKGLEFHTVIIPYANWKYNEVNNEIIWCNPNTEPFNNIDLLPISYSKEMLSSIYAEAYNNEALFKLVDNLNMLYVAFTRAKANLIIFSNANAKSNETGSVLAKIIDKTGLEGAVYNSEEKRLIYGEIVPSKKINNQEDDDKEEKDVNPFTLEPVQINQEFKSYDNRLTSRQSHNLIRFLAGSVEEIEDTEYMEKGEILHDIMSTLITGEELDKELMKRQIEGIIGSDNEKAQIKRLIERALSNPKAKPWFDKRYKIINECNILYRDGQQKSCRPDRVVIDGNNATVIDFKFGKEKPKHVEQVKGYMSNLALMGYRNVKGYLWYVYKNHIEEVK